MTVKIIARDTKISSETENTIEKKLNSHLKKYSQNQDDSTTVTVKITEKKPFTRVDVDMPYLYYHIHAEEKSADGVLAGIDKCVDILERQIEKYKTRMHRTKFKGKAAQSIRTEAVAEPEIAEENEYKIVKVENFELKPMHIEEAILQMEMLDNKFLVFHNTETDSMSVIYRRDDGNIGLIEPVSL